MEKPCRIEGVSRACFAIDTTLGDHLQASLEPASLAVRLAYECVSKLPIQTAPIGLPGPQGRILMSLAQRPLQTMGLLTG